MQRARMKFWPGARVLEYGPGGWKADFVERWRHVAYEPSHEMELRMDFNGAERSRRVETAAGVDNWKPSRSKCDGQ
jgi:hypothetical protein